MTTNNPWKTLSTRLVYENPWMKLQEDQVITPGGEQSIYSYVSVEAAAGVLAITDAQEILLIGQFRYPINLYTWEIIEGGVSPGESPEEAAHRELQEEAGVTCKSLTPLGPMFHLANSRSNECAHLFVAKNLVFGTPNPDSTEVLELRRVPIPQALQMVQSGEIQDAMSIIAIQRYALETPNF
ncbi:MAG: NUDIX hydrolase [Bdellovibrionales bacterium]|nr:NUDIX hydrolase [Bdellovibrionales bacterium]